MKYRVLASLLLALGLVAAPSIAYAMDNESTNATETVENVEVAESTNDDSEVSEDAMAKFVEDSPHFIDEANLFSLKSAYVVAKWAEKFEREYNGNLIVVTSNLTGAEFSDYLKDVYEYSYVGGLNLVYGFSSEVEAYLLSNASGDVKTYNLLDGSYEETDEFRTGSMVAGIIASSYTQKINAIEDTNGSTSLADVLNIVSILSTIIIILVVIILAIRKFIQIKASSVVSKKASDVSKDAEKIKLPKISDRLASSAKGFFDENELTRIRQRTGDLTKVLSPEEVKSILSKKLSKEEIVDLFDRKMILAKAFNTPFGKSPSDEQLDNLLEVFERSANISSSF